MAKQERYSKSAQRSSGQKNVDYGTFRDRDLAGMTPEAAQEAFQPKDPEPVRMHHKMAGGC